MLFGFGPALLAVAATVLAGLATNKPDLQGKTIVAYEKGYLNWLKPEYDSPQDGLYGMLPALVESLGGKFVTSKDLSAERPRRRGRVAAFASRPTLAERKRWSGCGTMCGVADRCWWRPSRRYTKGIRPSSFNDVLRPAAMQVRFDTAVPRSRQLGAVVLRVGPSGHSGN